MHPRLFQFGHLVLPTYGVLVAAGLIASLLQGTLLVRHAPPAVADAFCASRLGSGAAGGPGYAFGTLPDGLELAPVVDRARVSGPAAG